MNFSFKIEKEVVDVANDTKSGLVGYFYSNDMAQIWRVAKNLEYGMVITIIRLKINQ